jgi:ABC-2 type transport system ATP-binding protein
VTGAPDSILTPMQSGLVAIQVEALDKTFRVPRHRVDTLKERALHPFRRTVYDSFHVLRGIEFEVLEGEFFGIVGRNGSGKSTLLKCLAGIYRADSGTIKVAGRLSPFIELGVGFNPDLTARDNVLINAVMMGLTPAQARANFDQVVAFAELERFVDMKLKNYSSGMQVRLAFALMVHSDPDIMLIDEVLAVGDAAFQQKCIDVFYRLREQGKTIVLVTHDMGLVERFCHRALMLSGGDITHIGDPGEVGRAYLSENFQGYTADASTAGQGPVRLVDAWISDAYGNRVDAVAHAEPMALHVLVEATAELNDPAVALWLTNEEGVRVFSLGARENGEALADLESGERLEFTVEAENPLSSGRYHLGCSVTRGSAGLETLLFTNRATDVVSYGADLHGLVGLNHVSHVTRTQTTETVL